MHTIKPLKRPLKNRQNKALNANGSLMKVKSIAISGVIVKLF